MRVQYARLLPGPGIGFRMDLWNPLHPHRFFTRAIFISQISRIPF
jgi:hypothetical protein